MALIVSYQVIRLSGCQVIRLSVGGLGGFQGLGGGGEVAGFEVEKFLDFGIEELVVFISQLAIWVEGFGLLEFFPGAEIAIFSHDECFASEAGKGIEQAGVVGGIGVEPALFEGQEDLGYRELNYGPLEVGVVSPGKECGSGFTLCGDLFEPLCAGEN